METGVDDDFAARGFATLAPGSWGETCLARCEAPGPMRAGGMVGREPSVSHAGFRVYPLSAGATREGGTNFHFVTEGIQATLEQARDAAKGRTPISGVVAATIRQYLREALIDEMHIAIPPVLLGSGERLFYGIDLPRLGYKSTKHVASPNATHVVLTRA